MRFNPLDEVHSLPASGQVSVPGPISPGEPQVRGFNKLAIAAGESGETDFILQPIQSTVNPLKCGPTKESHPLDQEPTSPLARRAKSKSSSLVVTKDRGFNRKSPGSRKQHITH